MRGDQGGDDLDLADLVASRLCHDLVNPLGAIGNGVELIEMTGKADGPEMALIRDAVKAAEARIRLFRLAFGAAGGEHVTTHREAVQAVEGYFATSRIDVHWSDSANRPRREVKLGFLMLLCAESALPMSGAVEIGPDGAGGWALSAEGSRVNMDTDLWDVLRYGGAPKDRGFRPADAQFPVLARLARQMALSIGYTSDDTHLTLSAL